MRYFDSNITNMQLLISFHFLIHKDCNKWPVSLSEHQGGKDAAAVHHQKGTNKKKG